MHRLVVWSANICQFGRFVGCMHAYPISWRSWFRDLNGCSLYMKYALSDWSFYNYSWSLIASLITFQDIPIPRKRPQRPRCSSMYCPWWTDMNAITCVKTVMNIIRRMLGVQPLFIYTPFSPLSLSLPLKPVSQISVYRDNWFSRWNHHLFARLAWSGCKP